VQNKIIYFCCFFTVCFKQDYIEKLDKHTLLSFRKPSSRETTQWTRITSLPQKVSSFSGYGVNNLTFYVLDLVCLVSPMIQFSSPPLHIRYEIYNRTLPYKVELAFLASVHTLSSGYFQVSEASSCGEGSTGCPCKLETLNGDIFESRHFFLWKEILFSFVL